MILFSDRFLISLFILQAFGCIFGGDGDEAETVAAISGEEMVDANAGSVDAFHANDRSLDAFVFWGFLSSD